MPAGKGYPKKKTAKKKPSPSNARSRASDKDLRDQKQKSKSTAKKRTSARGNVTGVRSKNARKGGGFS